ncbi:MAG TPA: hypothetical protein VE783_07460 [Candidatus Limnocylindrales bacterium]|jgi:hypothetical protein|nr:hypothetical protein [Candidatus Limnocylindrales bacterium]
MDEAAELMHQALNESQSRINRWLRRDYSKLPKYKQGLDLMSESGIGSVASFAEMLRTPELKGSINYESAPDEMSRRRIVESVAGRRSAMLDRLELRQRKLIHLQGRLLCYCPAENLACGAAEVQSLGFFDVDNTPPWDTWVAYSEGVLLSWVPGELVELVNRGVQVNPEECIAWYDMRFPQSR